MILRMSGLAGSAARFAGTAEALRAEEDLARRLEAMGLEVERQPFRFLGWERGAADLTVET
ncbi:MAG: aminopeptidase, partial [Armatimonadetes bacterium]|nr:aminopeptidase [Armatimonadota bacterium]